MPDQLRRFSKQPLPALLYNNPGSIYNVTLLNIIKGPQKGNLARVIIRANPIFAHICASEWKRETRKRTRWWGGGERIISGLPDVALRIIFLRGSK